MADLKKELLVFEYNGTARSGKGSIVEYLSTQHAGVKSEETGADYRAITRALLTSGEIDTTMSSNEVTAKVRSLKEETLAGITMQRQAIFEEHGRSSLYLPDVNGLVAAVARVTAVRVAVKTGFRKRVEEIRDGDDYDVLLVEGRNLIEVVRGIADTEVLLRTFVSCTDEEAARRECERDGKDYRSAEGSAVLEAIKKRNKEDTMRELDPVRPDEDTIDYWQVVKNAGSLGVGGLAVQQNRQIFFDTTPFRKFDDPKSAMLEAAQQMFDDALKVA